MTDRAREIRSTQREEGGPEIETQMRGRIRLTSSFYSLGNCCTTSHPAAGFDDGSAARGRRSHALAVKDTGSALPKTAELLRTERMTVDECCIPVILGSYGA